MASTGDYYLDTPYFETATAVWTDSTLTTKAADGYYTFDGNWRYQKSGSFNSTNVVSCDIPPPPEYGTWNISSQSNSNSTTTACTYSLPNSVYTAAGDSLGANTQLYTNTSLTTTFNGGNNWWHMRSGGNTFAVYINPGGIIVYVSGCS